MLVDIYGWLNHITEFYLRRLSKYSTVCSRDSNTNSPSLINNLKGLVVSGQTLIIPSYLEKKDNLQSVALEGILFSICDGI